MIAFLANLLLALVWAAMTGNFELANLALGFALGYVALFLAQRVAGESQYFGRAGRVMSFLGFYLVEILKANLRVAADVVTPGHRSRPGIVAIPLDARTDAEITILANLLTMTPGSLSMDVSDDRRVLYVHAMFVEDAEEFRREIKESFERRVLEMLR
ncbi:MAG TPA: Na+/H+ antiporter subunit E [Candidatus Limnocylindrales bacterium]|jgi:multicomponent Na+:H+ antiporter subunit E|nr:Na+/H+ antiporter subunit E [Candidatus Limnocylindrales bacterium]